MGTKMISAEGLRDWVESKDPQYLAVDTETTMVDLDREIPDIVVASFAVGDSARVVWLRDHREHLDLVADLLVFYRTNLIFHNAAFDIAVLEKAGVGNRAFWRSKILAGEVHDTMFLDQLTRLATGGEGPGRPGEAYYHKEYDGTLPRRSLSKLHEDFFGEPLEKGAVRTSFGDIYGPHRLTKEQVEYAGQDAIATLRVFNYMRNRLPTPDPKNMRGADYGWWGPMSEAIQIAGNVGLNEIARRGLMIDKKRLLAKREEEKDKLWEATDILDEAGILMAKIGPKSKKAEVKMSEKALRDYLMRWSAENEHRGLKYTKTGLLSISKRDWDCYRGQDPVIDAFLTYKAGEKTEKTFIRRWLEYAGDDDVIRGKYRPLVASGRVSGFKPNLQQVPKRSGSLREVFCARPGMLLWELDYSTLELCCLGQRALDLLGESRMADLINEGRDLHRFIAARIYEKDEEEVTEKERFVGKMTNFGFGGGMGFKTFRQHVWTLARLDLDLDFCKRLKGVWLDTYPEMRRWLGLVPEKALKLAIPVPGLTDYDIAMILRGWHEKLGHLTDQQIGKVFEYLQNVAVAYRLDAAEWPRSKRLVKDVMKCKGSPALLDWINWRTITTRSGRRRCPVAYTEWLNTQFQGLAADGGKLAMARLWEERFDVCAFVHDSFLIETPEGIHQRDDAKGTGRAKQIMEEEMQKMVPDVKITVDVSGPYKYWGEPLNV